MSPHPHTRGRPATTSAFSLRHGNVREHPRPRVLGPKLREALILALLFALSALVILAPTGGLGRVVP